VICRGNRHFPDTALSIQTNSYAFLWSLSKWRARSARLMANALKTFVWTRASQSMQRTGRHNVQSHSRSVGRKREHRNRVEQQLLQIFT
jgi:hypothetical protein